MTKTECRKKYRELTKKTKKMMDEYFDKALRSGEIDLPSSEDNYRMPKNILCAALRECGWQWKPVALTNQRGKSPDEKLIENIYQRS